MKLWWHNTLINACFMKVCKNWTKWCTDWNRRVTIEEVSVPTENTEQITDITDSTRVTDLFHNTGTSSPGCNSTSKWECVVVLCRWIKQSTSYTDWFSLSASTCSMFAIACIVLLSLVSFRLSVRMYNPVTVSVDKPGDGSLWQSIAMQH